MDIKIRNYHKKQYSTVTYIFDSRPSKGLNLVNEFKQVREIASGRATFNGRRVEYSPVEKLKYSERLNEYLDFMEQQRESLTVGSEYWFGYFSFKILGVKYDTLNDCNAYEVARVWDAETFELNGWTLEQKARVYDCGNVEALENSETIYVLDDGNFCRRLFSWAFFSTMEPSMIPEYNKRFMIEKKSKRN